MSADELALKTANDRYRLDTLTGGVLAPLRRWGFGGLDEALYVLGHRVVPGLSARRQEYLRRQLAHDDAEIARRGDRRSAGENAYIARLLAVQPNPATLATLRRHRAALRRERIVRMNATGEHLSPTERARFVRQRLGDAGNALTDIVALPFGAAVGAFIVEYRTALATIVSAAVFFYALTEGRAEMERYREIASRYEASAPEAVVARQLKRVVPELAERATLDLAHWDEVECGDDEDCVEVPENTSDPQAARVTLLTMHRMVNDQLDSVRIAALPSVTAEQEVQLATVRGVATEQYARAAASLAPMTDIHVGYPAEVVVIVAGTLALGEAVEVLETYVPADLVDEENSSYRLVAWWRRIGLGAGYVMATGLFNLGRRKRREKYYGKEPPRRAVAAGKS